MNKKAQLSIFIIIAVVIVALVLSYFIFRDKINLGGVPSEHLEVYEYYEQCIEQDTLSALGVAGTYGGRINSLDYIPGSEFAPFSSHLNFMGEGIPYWYYVAGNGIIKENIPSKVDIENEIADYLSESLRDCDFSIFRDRGFVVEQEDAKVSINIRDSEVLVNVGSLLSVTKDNSSSIKDSFNLNVESGFGSLYDDARNIYSKEIKEAFLENYSVDVLRLYAPVDGVELSCSSKVWKSREVVEELQDALSANIEALRTIGSSNTDKYFVLDYDSDNDINFMYQKSWPMKVNIGGADGELMVAKPIGNQEGLGILGFCYSPYHFVYDISYPVMIQIKNRDELFQFPVIVVIDKNLARQGIYSELEEDQESFDLCAVKDKDVEIRIYDVELNSIEANVDYNCFDRSCPLGESKNGVIQTKVPSCLNGYLITRAEGYAQSKQLFSSNKENIAEIILDKEYNVDIELNAGTKKLEGQALVSFIGEDSKSASLPEFSEISLSEGIYNISVYVYKNSSIVLPASTKTQCQEVVRSGILGFFGGTREECFDITIPEMKIEYALIGGGKVENQYLFESDLAKGKLVLNAEELPLPTNLEQLQNNYEAFDSLNLEVVT